MTWDQTVEAIEAHKEVVLLKALTGMELPGIVHLEGIVEQDGWTYEIPLSPWLAQLTDIQIHVLDPSQSLCLSGPGPMA